MLGGMVAIVLQVPQEEVAAMLAVLNGPGGVRDTVADRLLKTTKAPLQARYTTALAGLGRISAALAAGKGDA